MPVTRILFLLSATLWATPGFSSPVAAPLAACTCKIQPSPMITTSWVDPLPAPITLSFYPNPFPTSSLPADSNSSYPWGDSRRAEGPPAEDKGTPGNRGQCRYNQCTSYQAPPSRTPVSSTTTSTPNPK